MGKIITSEELNINMNDILKQAGNEDILIKTPEGNIVALIDLKEYEEFIRLKKEAERSKRFALLKQEAKENAEFNKLTWEEAYALVERAREEVYQEKIRKHKQGTKS